MPRFPFLPKTEKFFDLFEESIRNTVKAAQTLKEMINSWELVAPKIAEITELEHQGDSVAHQIMAQLHRSFITPFDREDIALLAHSMDDITDFIESTADAMLIYKIKHPTQRAKELADVIVMATLEVQKAINLLRHKSNTKAILERCVEINRLENMADIIYRSAIGELFDDSLDITDIIKWREIYEHMETATDRCEDVANVLEGVALKHA